MWAGASQSLLYFVFEREWRAIGDDREGMGHWGWGRVWGAGEKSCPMLLKGCDWV